MITDSDYFLVQKDARYLQQMQDILIRWKLIFNQSKYIEIEHQIKDKQYGIEWRLAYFEEVKKEARGIIKEMGTDVQKSAFAAIDAQTSPEKAVPAENTSLILKDYIMDGDISLIQTINQIIAGTYQAQKKLVLDYQVVQVLNNAHFLAMIEVSITYLRTLLKVQDIAHYLNVVDPTCRQDIVRARMAQETSPYFRFVFSSLHIDVEADAQNLPTQALLGRLLEVDTQIKVIQEDQEKNMKAIDKLKSTQQQKNHFAWWYEEEESSEAERVDFDDQVCMLLEAHRDRCNKAKSQQEVEEYCRVAVSDACIVDVVDCRLYLCRGEEPMSVKPVYREECTERWLMEDHEKLTLSDGFCLDKLSLENPGEAGAYLARATLKSRITQSNLTGLPSWSEVKEGILVEEVHECIARMQTTTNKTLEKLALATRLQVWSQTFKKLKIPEQDEKPIALLELEDPYSATCKAIFQLYTMETIVHRAVNRAAINRDESKRNSIGRFASCLSKALQYAERNKVDCPEEQVTLYRGVILPDRSQIAKYQSRVGKVVNMRGYTSAYRDKEAAVAMALNRGGCPSHSPSVVFEMVLPRGGQSGFCFALNLPEHTIYPQQSEVLIDDGRAFAVHAVRDVIQKDHNFQVVSYTLIQLVALCAHEEVIPTVRLSTPQIDKTDSKTLNQYGSASQEFTQATESTSKDRGLDTFYSEFAIHQPKRHKEFIDLSHYNLKLEDLQRFMTCYSGDRGHDIFRHQLLDLSYNNLDSKCIAFLVQELTKYDYNTIKQLNLSGNDLTQEAVKQLAKLLSSGKLQQLQTLTIHDCPKVTTADLEILRLAASPCGVKILENNLKRAAEERLNRIGTAWDQHYFDEWTRQVHAFKEQAQIYMGVVNFNKRLHKKLYMEHRDKRDPFSQTQYLFSEKVSLNLHMEEDKEDLLELDNIPSVKSVKLAKTKEELEKQMCESLDVEYDPEKEEEWKEALKKVEEEKLKEAQQKMENEWTLIEKEYNDKIFRKKIEYLYCILQMFPLDAHNPKEEIKNINIDAVKYSEFYHEQFMKAHRVIDLTITEKNLLLLQHDHDFFDLAKKKKKCINGPLNKIKGEIIIKLDYFELPDMDPYYLYFLTVPEPLYVRNKPISGSYSGKEMILTAPINLSNSIIRLNVLLGSFRELIELRIQKIHRKWWQKYDLTKMEPVGVALIPWKECVMPGTPVSDLKQFTEQVVQRDGHHYHDAGSLGQIRGRVGWIDYHQHDQKVIDLEELVDHKSLFEYYHSVASTQADEKEKNNAYVTNKSQIEAPQRQQLPAVITDDSPQPMKVYDCLEVFQTYLEIYLTRKKDKKGKKVEVVGYEPIYKNDFICHYQLLRRDTGQVVFEFISDRQSPSPVSQKDRGTYLNNSQSYCWDKTNQSGILANNDAIRIQDIENESIIQLTIIEKIVLPPKQGGDQYKVIVSSRYDMSQDADLMSKLRSSEVSQHTFVFDTANHLEVKKLSCTLNFMYNLYALTPNWNIDQPLSFLQGPPIQIQNFIQSEHHHSEEVSSRVASSAAKSKMSTITPTPMQAVTPVEIEGSGNKNDKVEGEASVENTVTKQNDQNLMMIQDNNLDFYKEDTAAKEDETQNKEQKQDKDQTEIGGDMEASQI